MTGTTHTIEQMRVAAAKGCGCTACADELGEMLYQAAATIEGLRGFAAVVKDIARYSDTGCDCGCAQQYSAIVYDLRAACDGIER